MKVLIVNKFLYPRGGDAICALATGRLLASRGHEVTFWGMSHPSNPDYPEKHLFIDHVDLNSNVGFLKKMRIARNILYSPEAKKKMNRLLDEAHPDIVHLHNFAHQISPSIIPVLKKRNIPMIMTMHDYKIVCPAYTLTRDRQSCEKCSHGRYYHCLRNKCIKDSYGKSMLGAAEMYLHHRIMDIYDSISRFIAPSRFMLSKVREMGFDKSLNYLPNFANIENYIPSYTWHDKSIVYFGRLSSEKGLKTLIEAACRMRDVSLKIIGDGPMRSELQIFTQNSGAKNIQFSGYMSGDDLKEEIRRSMFVILPSECYENCPRSVLESFALGKPVIGSNIGGIPELVRDGETGYLFGPGDANDLQSKIEMLFNNPDQIIAMGKKARHSVEKSYSADAHYIGLMNIYEAVGKKI